MSIKVPKVTGSENVLKHDDIVSLGREFEGIGESRFLNWAEPYFPPINLYNLPYQLVTPATLQPINKIYRGIPEEFNTLYKLRACN